MFKKMFSRLGAFMKKRWAYFCSIIFIWVIPIYMLNEVVALTQVNIAFKITFMGCLVLLVVFIAFRKKIYGIIHKLPHGIKRGVAFSLHKAVTYGLLLGILWALSHFSDKFFNWWLLCGISILFGLIFIVVDEYLVGKTGGENETNAN